MNSQVITGTIFFDTEGYNDYGIPKIPVKLKKMEKEVFTDYLGVFTISIDTKIKKDTLLITCNDLTIEITDIILNVDKLDIGNFYIPTFKNIPIEEYKRLPNKRRQDCEPLYHWGQILSYTDKTRLENDLLTLNCDKKIDTYIFDSKNKTVKIDWNTIKNCM